MPTMNFKDLQFSLGKLSSDVKSHMAKKNPLYKNDTKVLSVWIFQERNDLATMRTLAYRRGETNKSFREWTTNSHEHWNDDDEYTDLQDIGDKLATLLTKANEIEQQYAARYQQYRHAIKSIREREDALCDRREKRQSLSARLVHLEKTNPASPKRQEIEAELRILDNETQVAEVELGDFKRFALQEAFYIRFNALAEYADKMKMVAGFGKYIVDLLDVEPTISATDQEQQQHEIIDQDTPLPNRKPYTSESQASLILNDCLFALDQWKPSEEDERPTLASQAIHDASNAEDANLLTEEDIRYYGEQGLASLTSSSPTGNTSNNVESSGNDESQQCQPPMYNNNEGDTYKWDEKCKQWDQNPRATQQQGPSTTDSLSKRDEAAYEQQLQHTTTNSNTSPPAYTAVQSPLPTAIQDYTRNDTAPEPATKDLTSTDNDANVPIQSSFLPAHDTHLECNDTHQMDYYQVYRNKQLTQPSHQSRPYTSFQQQFINTKNKNAGT